MLQLLQFKSLSKNHLTPSATWLSGEGAGSRSARRTGAACPGPGTCWQGNCVSHSIQCLQGGGRAVWAAALPERGPAGSGTAPLGPAGPPSTPGLPDHVGGPRAGGARPRPCPARHQLRPRPGLPPPPLSPSGGHGPACPAD